MTKDEFYNLGGYDLVSKLYEAVKEGKITPEKMAAYCKAWYEHKAAVKLEKEIKSMFGEEK